MKARRSTMALALRTARQAKFPKASKNPQNPAEWEKHQRQIIDKIRDVLNEFDDL